MRLPPDIEMRLEELAQGRSLKSLLESYQALSDRYRRTVDASSLQIRNESEALAYAIARMPATFGACAHVFEKLNGALPDFTPHTMLDIGAGPGTASIAAQSYWDNIDAVLLEPNASLRGLSRTLMPDAKTIAGTISQIPEGNFHLVIASYVLNELAPDTQITHIEKMWQRTSGSLVIIEPGTPLGYGIILKAREKLLSLGANIAAPCPHAHQCPLENTGRWCHMAERVERSSLHRKLKPDASLNYEDEKFSYIVATRLTPQTPQARLIGHPHGSKLVTLELCEKTGSAVNRTLSKRDEDYKRAKKLNWGDAL